MRSRRVLAAVCLTACSSAWPGDASEAPRRMLRETRRLSAAEAHQGVAVDARHFYAVANRSIGKYEKATGKLVASWSAPEGSPLRHLNSGVVSRGRLYAAHSNWPAKPLQNSIEIWDAATLKLVGRKTFARKDGALTWVDWRHGHWWIVFAYYGEPSNISRTTLVKLDDQWQQQATWRFPEEIVRRWAPFSNSGGSWGPDGLLHVTGHDRKEVYALRVGSQDDPLELVDVVPVGTAGQGIAWDRTDLGTLYGIQRKTKEVVASRMSHSEEFASLQRPVSWRRDNRNPILAPRPGDAFDSARCMNPWVVRSGDQYQLYYSGGDGAGRQRIGMATASVEALGNWRRQGPLFDTGSQGDFDARWCVLPHVVQSAAGWRLYYTGNAGRGEGLSAFPGIGLATRRDGAAWTKFENNPVLQPSGQLGDPDAIGIAGGSLLKVAGDDGRQQWRFYYTGCPTIGKPLALNQQKTICLAVSDDGIQWHKRGAVLYRDPHRDYENIGVAGPVVHYRDGLFRMWYSAIGARWGYYSICYAESSDGIHWRRGPNSGDNLQLTPQGDGWERQMVEYPSVIHEGDRLRMFYCGNGYGRTGIGTAVSLE